MQSGRLGAIYLNRRREDEKCCRIYSRVPLLSTASHGQSRQWSRRCVPGCHTTGNTSRMANTTVTDTVWRETIEMVPCTVHCTFHVRWLRMQHIPTYYPEVNRSETPAVEYKVLCRLQGCFAHFLQAPLSPNADSHQSIRRVQNKGQPRPLTRVSLHRRLVTTKTWRRRQRLSQVRLQPLASLPPASASVASPSHPPIHSDLP